MLVKCSRCKEEFNNRMEEFFPHCWYNYDLPQEERDKILKRAQRKAKKLCPDCYESHVARGDPFQESRSTPSFHAQLRDGFRMLEGLAPVFDIPDYEYDE